MNCDSARTEIIAYLKDELEAGKRKRLEEHFAKCPDCRKELEQARRLLTWTEAASDEAVVRLVEDEINQAISEGASDIHFEPQRDNTLTVRHRIDGVLHEVRCNIGSPQREGITARLKMMADMSVADTSTPQVGRIKWTSEGKDYDLRLSCVPYVYGEGIVVRIFDTSSMLVGIDKLGFYPEHLEALDKLIGQPCGLFVVAGPTGSGKTTTLYSILQNTVHPTRKVMSVENPVELTIPGVNQVQVNPKVGLTYPSALRALMRQDPDIICVGEITDPETAVASAEAAITGHLVLAAMHANDAAGAIQRLLDFGLEPYILASCMLGVLSQRLARKVCRDCAEEVEADTDAPELRFLGISEQDVKKHNIRKGRGCESCRNAGYRGRVGLYELLTIDRELAVLIANGATGAEIIEAAISKGFVRMRDDARRKVLDGITTPNEAFRVLSWQ